MIIAVDTSALVAVVAKEPQAPQCAAVLRDNTLLISAATLAEAFIVGTRPEFRAAMKPFLTDLEMTVVEVDEEFAERTAEAYRRWGKGFHRARLNYGDSFSYTLAEMYDCPLLYVGDDFARTDIVSALA